MIDGRNFYDQPINGLIKQYDEVRKASTGHGDNFTTGSLSDYAYFKDNYKLIAVDWSKQKFLYADPRTIQQIVFQGVAAGNDNTKIRLHYSSKIKRNGTRILQRNSKRVVTTYKWLNTIK